MDFSSRRTNPRRLKPAPLISLMNFHYLVNGKRRPAREGKKGVLGHFSPELSRALNILAIEESTTVQALMGEAFDLLMRARGKHPFGER